MPGGLKQLRVLDMGHNITAPVCANILGALGADVIKLERPVGGDNSRIGPPFVGPEGVHFDYRTESDLSLSFLKRNGYKRGITLDLKSPRGKAVFEKLVTHVDVLIENYRPGVLEKLGFGYERLQALNERLIICSISGFGRTGEYRDWVAYDGIIQAFSGLIARTGFQDQPPVKSGFSAADTMGALYGVIGILAALEQRRESGRGQVLDISMLDCLLAALWDDPLDVFARQGFMVRSGNNNQRAAPWNMYQCQDGWVFICALTDKQWRTLVELMGHEYHPRLGSSVKRHAHMAEVDQMVGTWCQGQTRAAVMQRLQSANVPCSAVMLPTEVVQDPHVQARHSFAPVVHPDLGPISDVVYARFPVREASSENSVPDPCPPRLGQHNREVYSAIGLDAAEIEQLAAEGVI